MTRQEVEDRVTYELLDWGRGYSYRVVYNGSAAPNIQWVRDNAEEGDHVEVEVYAGGRYHRRTVYFEIEPLTENEEQAVLNKRKRERAERDYQRQKFYNFEQRTVRSLDRSGREIENTKEAEKLVDRAWNWLGLDEGCKPSVEVTSRLSKKSCFYPINYLRKHSNHIGLAKGWGQDEAVLLHEIAHAATRQLKNECSFPAHGPAFAGICIALWVEFLDQKDSDWARLNDAAKERDIDVNYDLIRD